MTNCVTCGHARWTTTPSGRIKAKVAGKCHAPIVDLTPHLPACAQAPRVSKNSIWPDTCETCPTWIQKETAQ
jgi:hypothetical protein